MRRQIMLLRSLFIFRVILFWSEGADVGTSAASNDASIPNTCDNPESCVALERQQRQDKPSELETTTNHSDMQHKNQVTESAGGITHANEDLEDDFENDEDMDEDDEEEEEEKLRPGIEFGVEQTMNHSEVDDEIILETLQQTIDYMTDFATKHDYFVKRRGLCANKHELCTFRAAVGECETNNGYMNEHCAPACKACQPPRGEGIKFGVAQVIEHSRVDAEDVRKKMAETRDYVDNVVWGNEFYTKVRGLCFNQKGLCTVWAVQGHCQNSSRHAAYMEKYCAPACGTCELLHYETRCPIDSEKFPDAWAPGDLNRMFERVVTGDQHNVRVWSRPDLVNGDERESADYEIGPWIITIDDFITQQEAEKLIAWGASIGYERSIQDGGYDEETGEELDSEASGDRTSTTAWCDAECEEDAVVAGLFDRIQELTGVPQNNSELIQFLNYQPGEFYLTHSDYIPQSHLDLGGPRILTVFIYLSDVEEGGETRFDYLDLKVPPKVGRAAVWPSVLDEDPNQQDERTYHEAMPVIKGQKFAANAWLHLRDYTTAGEMGC